MQPISTHPHRNVQQFDYSVLKVILGCGISNKTGVMGKKRGPVMPEARGESMRVDLAGYLAPRPAQSTASRNLLPRAFELLLCCCSSSTKQRFALCSKVMSASGANHVSSSLKWRVLRGLPTLQ